MEKIPKKALFFVLYISGILGGFMLLDLLAYNLAWIGLLFWGALFIKALR